MLRTIQTGGQMKILVGLQQSQRQIVIDMRVHSSQRELYAIDIRTISRLEQCKPGSWRIRRLGNSLGDGREIEFCKYHIKMRQPCLMFPTVWRRLRVDLLRHLQAEHVKPLEPLIAG